MTSIANFVRDISERKYAEETLRASEARLTMQYSATRVLAESTTIDEAVWRILQVICADDEWDVGAYWIVDPQGNVLRCRDIWHPSWVAIPRFVEETWQSIIPPGVELPARVWMSGEPIWASEVEDIASPRAQLASREGLHSTFCFAISVGGTIHGVMEVYSRAVRTENDELARAMATIGRQVGQFIERKMAEEALEYQAMHDALTDLPNRSLLFDRLNHALQAARRSQRPLALLVMDLDRFKEVNDTHGHHYGDLVLREAARRLRRTLRGSDTVARLGGDEFAMLLPGTDENGAIQAAQKVVLALEQPFELEGRSLDAGVSVGVALFPTHGEETGALLRRADAAMYTAKRGSSHYALYATDSNGHVPERPVPADQAG
jgi:diguanylate cyclase (GGDEF)-like protein